MTEPTATAFPVMSDDSLRANASVFAGELLRRAAHALVHDGGVALSEISIPLPFSRAEGADYVRLVALWNTYRETHPLQVPPRPCPACRSSDSRFEFFSYDRYPYHACANCGTWFVPLLIDDRVIDEFFDATPEARQLSDKMMAGRNQRTRDSDRARFTRYFDMLSPQVSRLPGAARYLDLGCGVGHSVELAHERGWQAVGVELNEVAVTTARANGRHVVRPADAPVDQHFDVISLFETLEHITDPDAVMGGLSGSLAPGGIVMITVPHRASFELSVLRGRCFHVFGGCENVGHINLFDATGIEAFLQRHGLTTLFLDGEFSSDLAQLLAFLSERRSSGPQPPSSDHLTLSLAPTAHDLVNVLGPAFAAFERALKRSPILIAIACRPADLAELRTLKSSLEANWRASMDILLKEVERNTLKHNSTLSAMLASLQHEVSRLSMAAESMQTQIDNRDALLASRTASMQYEINSRDELLHGLQHSANELQRRLTETYDALTETKRQLDSTVDRKLRRVARRIYNVLPR